MTTPTESGRHSDGRCRSAQTDHDHHDYDGPYNSNRFQGRVTQDKHPLLHRTRAGQSQRHRTFAGQRKIGRNKLRRILRFRCWTRSSNKPSKRRFRRSPGRGTRPFSSSSARCTRWRSKTGSPPSAWSGSSDGTSWPKGPSVVVVVVVRVLRLGGSPTAQQPRKCRSAQRGETMKRKRFGFGVRRLRSKLLIIRVIASP